MKLSLMDDFEDAKFQMAPMIDMVFLLLVFFMCTSTVAQKKSMTIDMPTASKGVVPKDRPDRWVVNVTSNGTIYSGTTPISVEELKNTITARVKADPNLKIYLRGDAHAKHRQIREVIEAMAAAGIDDLIFGVNTPPERAGGGA